MEQIAIFLTEYSGQLCWILGIIAVIFLGMTLHRIKKIEQQIYKQNQNVQTYLDTSRIGGADEVKQKAISTVSDEKTENEEAVRQLKTEAAMEQKSEAPEKLINAVIDEVFP